MDRLVGGHGALYGGESPTVEHWKCPASDSPDRPMALVSARVSPGDVDVGASRRPSLASTAAVNQSSPPVFSLLVDRTLIFHALAQTPDQLDLFLVLRSTVLQT